MSTDSDQTAQVGNHPKRHRRRMMGRGPSYYAQGEPMVWLTGGSLALCFVMIVVMLVGVFYMGSSTFWPLEIQQVKTMRGDVLLGEQTREQRFKPDENIYNGLSDEHAASLRAAIEADEGYADRRLLRTGNFDLVNKRFDWVNDDEILEKTTPEWAVVMERMKWGRFYGIPVAFKIDGEIVAEGSEAAWAKFEEFHPQVRARFWQRHSMEKLQVGSINRRQEEARQDYLLQELYFKEGDITETELAAAKDAYETIFNDAQAEYETVFAQIQKLRHENERYELVMEASTGQTKDQPLAEVVLAYPANQQSFTDKIGIYLYRWYEFIFHDPREANTEGGVWPAIVGTIAMTLIMTLFVVPIGVLAALYLREYAKAGPLVSAVRIAINNLAGVPSIVFGVFGLGFFCYLVGGTIDDLFYPASPTPVYAKGGVLWASLTLALLTLPVVIVATEEALAAVPGSMRQGSYACGASKWQTIKRIVLPRAMPGIMTGTILAMARGAGEVAPLMLVGAVKIAPHLPIDFSNFGGSLAFLPTGPLHPDRSFMHLGFHIYDVGFQSPDSEAARPMVFTTTMLLIAIVVVLNISAMFLRARLKKKFAGSVF